MESFQIIHGISGLFLCEWVYHMYAHMYRMHMHVNSQRTTMGAVPHLFCFCFETESLTDLELRESPVFAHQALGFTSLHHQI